MNMRIARSIFALGSVLAMTACVEPVPVYREPPAVIVRAPLPPPEIIVERPPPLPGPEFVWQEGHWRYVRGQYVWNPGHYVRRPQPAAVWVPPHWTERDGAWFFTDGHWR